MARIRRKKRKSFLRRFISFIMTLVVIAALIGAAGVIYAKDKLDNISHVELDEGSLAADNDISDYRNIVILGVDTRDMSNFSGSRTDSIIIVSINRKSGDIKLISVYRDSFLDIEGVGLDKVTHAFAYGGPERTINTLNRNLDLNITEFAALNFKTVAKVVDSVGGIDIDIKDDEISQMNTYLPETARYLKCDFEYITAAGKQHLDGVQAVTYSRIRHTEGGDYRRTERMRTVLTAVFKEVKKMGFGELNKMMDDVLPEVSSNIDSMDIIPLMLKMYKMDIKDSIGWPYDKEGYISSSQVWYAAPVTLESNVTKLHEDAFSQSGYVPSDRVREISGSISYTTGYYGY